MENYAAKLKDRKETLEKEVGMLVDEFVRNIGPCEIEIEVKKTVFPLEDGGFIDAGNTVKISVKL